MSKNEDITESLKPNRIRRDNAALQSIQAMLKETMNPFDTEMDPEQLYNIGTGKSSSENTANFLLNVADIGKERKCHFISECIQDPSRFEKRIKREKLYTFASEVGKRKLQGSDGKVVAACLVRDLFGSILYHSLKQKIDMGEVLKYPLTPVPLSLCHVDGTMQKTPKAVILKHLESQVITTPPTSVDTTIIDASFFLHLLMNSALPSTFGGVSRFLLQRILSAEGNIIHYVTDKWLSPSIKDCERDSRASSSVAYQITGSAQKRPSNWISALRNTSFKKSLIEFLVNSWEKNDLTDVFQQKTLFANSGDICYSFRINDSRVVKTTEDSLYSDHEEADSRMFYHLANVPAPNNVVIRTCDTDCLVIALGCYQLFDQSLKIWIEAGLQSNNTQRYISINQIHAALGESFCNSLPAYHAFTGCDYSPSFSRKGKIKPLKLLQKNNEAQTAFSQLGSEAEISEDTITKIEKFVCEMYGKKKLATVDEVRLQIFFDKYKPKKGQQGILCVKRLDGSALPPCSRVLLQKIRRTHLIARRWLSSTKCKQSEISPIEFGWKEEDGSYRLKWFDGDTSPKTLDVVCSEDSLFEGNDTEEEGADASEEDEQESDSDGESSEEEM